MGISGGIRRRSKIKSMPPSHATHTRQTKNALIWNRTQRRSADPGGSGGSAAAGLAVTSTIGGEHSPRAKFFAAYADGSRVQRADRYRAKWKVQGAVQSCFPDLVEVSGGAHIRPSGSVRTLLERLICSTRKNEQIRGLLPEPAQPLGHLGSGRTAQPGRTEFRPGPAPPCPCPHHQPRAQGRVEHPKRPVLGLRGEPPQHPAEGPQGRPRREPSARRLPLSVEARGEGGEEVEELMAGELTLEQLEEILTKGRGGKRSRQEAELEDGEEIVGSATKEEFYQAYKRLRPLDMTKSWNSIRAYAEYTYKADAGLLPAIPVELEVPEYRDHVEQADKWFAKEVRPKGPGMRHRILVIEGETGTGKTAYTRSKGKHSRMCNVWNVAALSEDADIWILDDMVSTNGKYSLKALSQYEADFTGRYQRVKTMKVRPTVILGNSRAAITTQPKPETPVMLIDSTQGLSFEFWLRKCWSDIEGEEGEAWVARNVEWVYSGGRPFFVFP
ncbi:hypothetical protein RhiJN_01450 [Ceratobasidium sp. AG-Ba]|nr:hypothetical protein RhiJN_01450 [Ceratobasidium sp. AG-Ba]